MLLTNRDKELLRGLRSYGLFTTKQIAQLYFPGVALTTVLRRLRKLEATKYLQRITGIETYEAGWALASKGANAVNAHAYKRVFRKDILDHELKLVSLRLKLEGTRIAQSWIPEHEIRAQVARKHGLRDLSNRIIPDGLMGVNVNGLKESVAIELELNFKNTRRYEHTFIDYSIKRNVAFVWYLVQEDSLGRHLAKIWSDKAFRGHGVQFIWSNYFEVIESPATAKLHGTDTVRTLKSLWSSPALPPAQALSSQELRPIDDISEPTDQKQKETLALAV